jgi:L-fuconolactonase
VIVDAHFHCWQLVRGDYGWLTPALGPIHRDVSIADWIAVSDPCGVQGGVLVQAAPTEAETGFLLAQAESEPAVLGVVGWADLLAADAPERIARLAARPKLKALRPMLHDLPDPQWILQPALEPAIDAMIDHGLAFDALVRPVHLAPLLQFCQRHPGLRVVVDHAAKPDIAAALWQPWADDIARIADQTQAVCKLSGLLTEAGAAPQPPTTRRWARHVLERFGADRVLWGSDWPVLELASDYRAWWIEAQAALAEFGPGEREAVLGGTAERVYRLRAPAPAGG